MDDWERLPAKVFVSHSYEDESQIEALKQRLPGRVSPVIWPLQEPDPSQAVSDGIVEQILACEGLIYLEGGDSENSLWVNFERDYARRIDRQVFAFDAQQGSLRVDSRPPVDLNAMMIVSPGQKSRADRLLGWLKNERHFEIEEEVSQIKMKEIFELVARVLYDSKVVIWFLDTRLGGIAHFAYQLDPEESGLLEHLNFLAQRDGKGMFHYSSRDLYYYPSWLAEHSMHVRLNPNFEPAREDDPDLQQFILSEFPVERSFYSGWGVDLVPDARGDGFDWTRADDLIVRLTVKLQRARRFVPESEVNPGDE